MFVHTVYFWLREDASDSDRRAFEQGLTNLLSIETIDHAYKGMPATTDRPAIDRTYSYGIVVVFRDKSAHDAYQAHPAHDMFREDCERYWRKVQIYDFVSY
jgi:hypothetical protein